MEVLFSLPLLFVFVVLFAKGKGPVRVLISLQVISIYTAFLVAKQSNYQTLTTLFNIVFVNLNIFLIIAPWSSPRFKRIVVENKQRFGFFKKILYIFLFFNLILSSTLLVIILILIPDIAKFKAELAFYELYESIPGFANAFRYSYTSQQLGYLAIPICFYHLSRRETKKSLIALIASSSSLVVGFAFYSRAQIFTFSVVVVVYFLLVKDTLPLSYRKKVYSGIKKTSLIVAFFFLVISVVRFSAMDYYGDRIPEESLVKDPILYSLVDYTSQGYSNGINQLEKFSDKKGLNGEQFFRDVYQILNFFVEYDWNAEDSQEAIDEAYGYDGGAFKGYTCSLVFNFGYFWSFLISLSYFLYVRLNIKDQTNLSIDTLYVLILLLAIPVTSIFYSGFPILYFPLFFLMFTNLLYFVKRKLI